MKKKKELEQEFFEVKNSFLELQNTDISDSEKIDSINYFIYCIPEYIDKLIISSEEPLKKFKSFSEKTIVFTDVAGITNIIGIFVKIFNPTSALLTMITLFLIEIPILIISSIKTYSDLSFDLKLAKQYNLLLENCKKELNNVKKKVENNTVSNKQTNSYEYKIKRTRISYNSSINNHKTKIRK